MLLRAITSFLALPGVVGCLVPILIAPRSRLRVGTLATTTLAVGILILVWCTVSFYISGKGTLAPWSPPKHLVQGGLYRFSRNPMYVGVLLIILGWALLFRSSLLGWYALAVAIVFHIRVVVGEEPWLARTHGAEWQAYRGSVPRWFINLPRKGHRRGA